MRFAGLLISIIVAIIGLPILILGPPFLSAGIYRLILHFLKYNPQKAKNLFWKQVAIIEIAWIIALLLYFGVR